MVESLSLLLLHVIAKNLYAILALIEPQRILNLSICKHDINTKSEGNVVADFPGIGRFSTQFDLILKTLENRFEVSVDDEGNSELVLPTIESHEGILFRHVCPHCFTLRIDSRCLSLEDLLCSPWRQFRQKCFLLLTLLLLLASNRLRFLTTVSSSGDEGGGLIGFGSLVHFGWSLTDCEGLGASIDFKGGLRAGISFEGGLRAGIGFEGGLGEGMGFVGGLGAGVGFEGGREESMNRSLSQRKVINSAFLRLE